MERDVSESRRIDEPEAEGAHRGRLRQDLWDDAREVARQRPDVHSILRPLAPRETTNALVELPLPRLALLDRPDVDAETAMEPLREASLAACVALAVDQNLCVGDEHGAVLADVRVQVGRRVGASTPGPGGPALGHRTAAPQPLAAGSVTSASFDHALQEGRELNPHRRHERQS